MKFLFLILFFYSVVRHCYGQCNAGSSNRGSVYEYAQSGTVVLNLITDNTNNFTLELKSPLNQFFDLINDTILIVKDGVNITRSDGGIQNDQITGEINCRDSGLPFDIPIDVYINIIKINNLNPVEFQQSLYTDTLEESQDIGYTLTVTANDDDDSDITYEIVNQIPSDYFSINEDNGILTLNEELDYELHKEHNLTIVARSVGPDNFGNDFEQSNKTEVIINVRDVDDMPPQFEFCSVDGDICIPPLYTAVVNSSEINTVVVNPPIQATDGDTGINNTIEYSFVNGTNSYKNYFEINPSSGMITQIKPVPSNADISEFVIAVKATEIKSGSPGRSSVAYLIISVVYHGGSKPTFEERSYSGYIFENLDNPVLSYVTEDAEGLTPLRLVVKDADNPNATFFYEVDPPYQISREGYLFYASTSRNLGSSYAERTIKVRAINPYAELNSPNRVSDDVDVVIQSVEVTTLEPTTTQPETTTMNPSTTDTVTTAEPITSPIVELYPTEGTTEACPICTCSETTINSQGYESTIPCTCPTVEPCPTQFSTPCSCDSTTHTGSESTFPFICPTVEPCPTVTATEPCPTCSCDSTTSGVDSTISFTCPKVEPCPTETTSNPCPTCSCDNTLTTDTQTTSFVTCPTCPTQEPCPTASCTSKPCPSCNCSTATATACPVCSTVSTGGEVVTNEGGVAIPPPVGYVSETVLYGVSGGLSGVLLICIIVIIFLACKIPCKDDDLEKNELLDSSDVSTSGSTTSHKNPAYLNDVDQIDEVSHHSEDHYAYIPTSFSNQTEELAASSPDDNNETDFNNCGDRNVHENTEELAIYASIQKSFRKTNAPDDDSETNFNDFGDRKSYENTDFNESVQIDNVDHSDYGRSEIIEEVDEEENNDNVPMSSFSDEIRRGAAAIAAAATTAAVVGAAQELNDEHNNAETITEASPVILGEGVEVQDYESAYKHSQVIFDSILEVDNNTEKRLVTIQKYGIEAKDTKSEVEILKISNASSVEISSMQAKIRLLQKVCDQDHDNILQFCGSYEDQNEIHCAVIYEPNGTLQDYLRSDNGKPPLSSYDIMQMMTGIGRGLQYLHAKNIVHCHLQSCCVMLNEDLTPKLRDFENNEVSTIKIDDDRIRWQALEILNGDLSSVASDVWSFGVVMWEIVSRGMLPYSDKTDDEVKKFLEDGNRLKRPQSCSETIFSIIESCWNADPRFRPDMYLLVSNLSEKLTQDASELVGMDVKESEVEPISHDDVSISIDDANNEELTMF